MSRPCKLTPEVQERIVMAIRGGVHREIAATLGGIGKTTFYRWMAAGENGNRNGKFRVFWDALKKAEAEWEEEQVKAIREIAKGGQLLSRTTTERKDGSVVVAETYSRPEWTARAWLLERKAFERWAKRERIDMTVLNAELEAARKEFDLTDDEIEKLKAMAVKEADTIARGHRG